jgi:hypothetical protein
MWLGNTNNNTTTIYIGAGSDSGPILTKVLTAPGNTTFSKTFQLLNAYEPTDVNMDGKVIYIGTGADTGPILSAVLTHPLNTTFSKTYQINQQLP